MSGVKYAITILKEKLANADQHNLAYQRLSVAEMEAIWGTLEKSEKDYTKLEARRDALASESAARGEIIERLIGQYGAAGYHAIQNSLNPAQSLLYDAMQVMKQPATDAYLNSVRAEAVASFAHHHRVIADSETDPTIQRGHRITAGRAEDFAAQLRAGEPS